MVLNKLIEAIYKNKPTVDELAAEAHLKRLNKDPNTLVSFYPEDNTLVVGVVIAKTADDKYYYVSRKSLDSLRRDPHKSAASQLSDLTIIPEDSLPKFKDRLIPFLNETVIKPLDSAGENFSAMTYVQRLDIGTHIMNIRLRYRAIRGSEIGSDAADKEYDSALKEIGYVPDREKMLVRSIENDQGVF